MLGQVLRRAAHARGDYAAAEVVVPAPNSQSLRTLRADGSSELLPQLLRRQQSVPLLHRRAGREDR